MVKPIACSRKWLSLMALSIESLDLSALALWMFHPTLHRVIRLANMEMQSENTADISVFFILFNEVLQYASGDKDYKFNPSAFVCNEAGTNFCGIKEVYGEEFVKTRVFGCQWHFQNDMHRKVQSIGDAGIREKFVNICKKILQATTVSKYNVLKSMAG